MEKLRRGATDIAAQKVINQIIQDSGLNNRTTDEASNGRIGYNRVRDLRLGEKGPLRLSEFLVICEVCSKDPTVALQQIIDTAGEIERELLAAQHSSDESDADDMLKSFSKSDDFHPGLAADIEHDKNLEKEHGGERY